MHICTSMNRTRRKVPRKASRGKASEYPRAERHAARKRGCFTIPTDIPFAPAARYVWLRRTGNRTLVNTLSIHCLRFFITVSRRGSRLSRGVASEIRRSAGPINREKRFAARTCVSGIGCWRNRVVPLQRKCYFALVVLGTTLRTWLLANIRQSLRASQVESVSLSRWSNQGRIYARISATRSSRHSAAIADSRVLDLGKKWEWSCVNRFHLRYSICC